VSLVSHHLITYAREASHGRQNASNYSLKLREAQVPAE
jgi:hopanoid C-2 methylase